ncbi:MAG TPA: hypothetical protein P5217_02540 [Methanoregulaceae archaeon]|nr:hypothetical protein [Methanoregulaceae archaeon]HRY75140.1 hypothetical protein [Methanoregulaceae archaeon]
MDFIVKGGPADVGSDHRLREIRTILKLTGPSNRIRSLLEENITIIAPVLNVH